MRGRVLIPSFQGIAIEEKDEVRLLPLVSAAGEPSRKHPFQVGQRGILCVSRVRHQDDHFDPELQYFVFRLPPL